MRSSRLSCAGSSAWCSASRASGSALSGAARATLHAAATAPAVLEFGGRGIGSLLERAFVNPLARELFTMGSGAGEELTVTEVRHDNGQWGLSLQSGRPDQMIITAATGTT